MRQSPLKLDIATAYAASAAKVISWAVVSAVVYRVDGAAWLAILATIRATLSFLNYLALGLPPAIIRLASEVQVAMPGAPPATTPDRVLDYATPADAKSKRDPVQVVFSTAQFVSMLVTMVGILAIFPYAAYAGELHGFAGGAARDEKVRNLAVGMGLGLLLRLLGDVGGAVLQVRGRISLDNALIALGELSWLVVFYFGKRSSSDPFAEWAGITFAISGAIVAAMRMGLGTILSGFAFASAAPCNWTGALAIARYAGWVSLAQVSDFLYAPAALILVSWYLSPVDGAAYAAAIQIDAALLLLVSGVAAVALPRAAIAFAAGDVDQVGGFYRRATVAMWLLLAAAAGAIWLLAGPLLRAWLGEAPAGVLAILPLVLVHSVIGGVGSIARSVMLAIGREKAYTAAALIAGVCNVLLAWVLVAWLGWGLKGIPTATIIVVVARYLIWQPWYFRRVGLRSADRPVVDAGG